MSMTLDGTTIRNPNSITEENSTQTAQNRTLDGAINRDQFGSNKRIWTMDYKTVTKADYDIINALYQAYLLSGSAVAFVSDETNYTISSTNVHIDLLTRDFTYRGDQYLSDFTLILTEA